MALLGNYRSINWKGLVDDIRSGNAKSMAYGIGGAALGLPEMGYSEAARTPQAPVDTSGTNEDIQSLADAIRAAYESGVADGSGGGGGAGGGDTYEAQPVFLPSTQRTYDLANPLDREAFFKDKAAWYDQMAGNYQTDQEGIANTNIASAERDTKRNLDVYGENLGTLGVKRGDYLSDWEAATLGIDERARLGDVRRQGTFMALGPNAYQSSMGTSGQYAEGKRKEAQALKGREKTRELANFGAQEKDINRAIEDSKYYLEAYKKEQRDAAARAVNAYRDSLNQNLASDKTDMLQADASTGVGAYDPSRYAYKQYDIYKPTVDSVDSYMPYLDFTSQATPTANRLISEAKKLSTASVEPIPSYLGDAAATRETDPLKQYGVV